MGLFGTSKSDLEQEIERLKAKNKSLRKQNSLLLMLFDSWVTKIKLDYDKPKKSDGYTPCMRWGPDPEAVFDIDAKLQSNLNNAKTREQKIRVYAEGIPELVEMILQTSYWVPDLSEEDQKRYQGIMEKVRMYYFAYPDGAKFRDEIIIGDPPNLDF